MSEASHAWNFPEKGSDELPRVLMIEDNPADAHIVRRVLEDAGIAAVETVGTAEEGLRVFGEGEWDLVLLDYRLPGSSGLEALDRLREIDPDVPTIMLTGAGDEQVAADAIRLGATEYLSKDDMATLLPTVVTMLLEEKSAGARRPTPVRKDPREEELKKKVVEADKRLLQGLPPDSAAFGGKKPAAARRQLVSVFAGLYRAIAEYSGGLPSAELLELCRAVGDERLSSRQIVELHVQAVDQVIREETRPPADLASRLNEGLLLAVLWLNDSWRSEGG